LTGKREDLHVVPHPSIHCRLIDCEQITIEEALAEERNKSRDAVSRSIEETKAIMNEYTQQKLEVSLQGGFPKLLIPKPVNKQEIHSPICKGFSIRGIPQ